MAEFNQGAASDRYGREASDNKNRKAMIRKLKSGEYRLYSRKQNPKTGKRKSLGTFETSGLAERQERAVQYFKRTS